MKIQSKKQSSEEEMQKKIITIVSTYLQSRFKPSTEERVQRWLIKEEHLEEKEVASLDYWNHIENRTTTETDLVLQRVNQRIGHTTVQTGKKIPIYKKWSRIAAIVLPLALISGGYLFYQTKSSMIEVHLAYGEQKHLFLPDSSEVWINAGSTLRYPKKFKNNQRKVILNGEAYFSVKKDPLKPFLVNTDKLTIRVLGTAFNVKAYKDENKILTTLTKGKIEVRTKKETLVLNPNEQLSFNKQTKKIKVVEVPSNETTAWLNNQLIFNNATLTEIFQTLERKFNIKIKSTFSLSNKLYTIKFLYGEELEEILELLQEIVGFSYELTDNEVKINPHA